MGCISKILFLISSIKAIILIKYFIKKFLNYFINKILIR